VPFQREKTEQSPTLIFDGDEPLLVLGSAGSARIPGSIVQTVVNVVDHGMDLEEALYARRWFIAANELRIEADGLPNETLDALERLGYELRTYPSQDGYFAKVHVVMRDPATGILVGASDPRDFGAASGR
jgi:gamma-glutamyltranspeptidase/glutathione hydrolase